MRKLLLLAAFAALSACATRKVEHAPETASIEVEEPSAWLAVATSDDAARVEHLPDLWREALASAHRFQKQVQAEGDLLVADAARTYPAPPPGSYRCRLVKIGAATKREPAFRSFPDFFCYIRGDMGERLFFAKQTGSERPSGWLYPDGDRRMVLTGATQRTDGEMGLSYGDDPARDLAGVFERVGPFRWRLVLPWRGDRAGLDVLELVPVPPEQQADEPQAAPVTDEAAAGEAGAANP